MPVSDILRGVIVPLLVFALLGRFFYVVSRFYRRAAAEKGRIYATESVSLPTFAIEPNARTILEIAPRSRRSTDARDVAYRAFYLREFYLVLRQSAVLWIAIYVVTRL